MEFVIVAPMAVFGAAMVVGGFVAYRRSESTGVRALGAAAIAAVAADAGVGRIVAAAATGEQEKDRQQQGRRDRLESCHDIPPRMVFMTLYRMKIVF